VFSGSLVISAVGDGQIVGLDRATGRLEWTAAPPVELTSALNDDRAVAIAAGVVVATSTTFALYGYDALTGATRWKRVLQEGSFFGLSADDSSAYVALSGGAVLAISAGTGTTRWTWGQLVPMSDPSKYRVLGRPGLDRDFVYIPGEFGGYKVRK